MLEKNKVQAYAMACATHLVAHIENINSIILYGSAARGDFDEKSDIDLFIESADKNIKGEVDKVLESYYKTSVYKNWVLKGISFPISAITGRIDSKEWQDLKRAMANTGITLYGKYKTSIENTHHYILFSFENIKPDKKRIALFRKLFGFTINKKKYPGMANRINAKKIGKGALIVPIEHARKLKIYFNEKKIPVKMYDFWTDSAV